MSKAKIFFVLSSSFLSGVLLASFFEIENYFLLILVLASVVVFVLGYRRERIIVASAAILFLAAGAWRTNVSLEFARSSLADQKIGLAEFVGMVAREPEVGEKNQKIIVEVKAATEDYYRYADNGSNFLNRKCKIKVLTNVPIYPEYKYGDELKIKCILQKPENFSENFDYQMYLAKDGIYRICEKAQIETLTRNKGGKIYSAILSIKNKFEARLSKIFPEPEGAYLKGLLLGGSRRMPQDLVNAFSRTGTSHTVAVSGYNVTIVAAFLMWLGIWLGLWRQQVFSFAVVGIVLFVLMTGAPSSAVRAGIMGTLVIWAMKEGRLANSTNAILFAASAMLLINPLLLRYDTGFQLSFLATIGIVQFSPILENFFWRERKPKLIQETIFLTMSAMIFVLPILLNSFEKISLVAFPANLLILPMISAIMGTGFVAGFIGFIFLPLGKLIGFLPYLLLKIELDIVQWLSSLPWASVEVKNFEWAYVSGYYLTLGIILYLIKRKRRSQPATGDN